MRMTTAGVRERRPHRSRLDHPSRPAYQLRRGELAAGLAAVAVLAQLALAPVTLLVAGSLALAGRIARWQLAWLLLPALCGACWLAVAGLPATMHALAAGAGQLMAAELAVAAHPARLLHPAAVFASSVRWLPRELPLLVLAGVAEAAVVSWLDTARWPSHFPRQRSGWQPLAGAEAVPAWRPGLVAALRRRVAARALASGHTVTASGSAIGVTYHSGRLAAVSWARAERGVLLTGGELTELDQIGLAIACAAVRRRKAVLVLDISTAGVTRDRTGACSQVGLLAERLGVPVTCMGSVPDPAPGMPGASDGGILSVSGALGRAIRSRSVVLVPAVPCEAAQPGTARRALSDLAGMLTSLRERGLRADCLAWVRGCEASDLSLLSELLSLGHATGTAVLLSATSPALAADLAAAAGLVVVSGPSRGTATMIADGSISGRGSFLTVPIDVTEVR
jgi:hypothetical protein